MDNRAKFILAGIVAVSYVVIRESAKSDSPIKAQPLESQVMRHRAAIWSAGVAYGVEPALIASIMSAESSGLPQPPRLVEVSGGTDYVVGLMQIRLDTAYDHCDVFAASELENNRKNIECGTNYLRYLLDRFGLVQRAVSAYNAGPGNISVDPTERIRYVNPEYVRKVLGMIQRFRLLFMAYKGGNEYLDRFPGWKWEYVVP